jgi:dinuclear metal center YbgI/SA1388 family protein
VCRDNVGLLIDSVIPNDKNCFKVLITNDLTEKVVQEAIDQEVNAVVTYHPTPFKTPKKLQRGDHISRVVLACVASGIAVYAPHTGLDGTPGGINDWLLSGFGNGKLKCLKKQPLPTVLLSAVGLTAEAGAALAPGAEFDSPVDCLHATVLNAPFGEGRILRLDTPISLHEAVAAVKAHLKLDSVQLAPALHSSSMITIKLTSATAMEAASSAMVSTIAVCAGSGASMLGGVVADLYVTGEMSHHDVLSANANGASVILTNHSNSERGYLPVLEQRLHATWALPGVTLETSVTTVDADPLVHV